MTRETLAVSSLVPREIVLQALFVVLVAYLFASLPLVWRQLLSGDPGAAPEPPPPAAPPPAGGGRPLLGTAAAALVALWFGGFLAGLSPAGAQAGPPPRRAAPPVTAAHPGPLPDWVRKHPAPRPHVPPLVLAQAPPRPAVPRAAAAPGLRFDPEEPTRIDFREVDVKALLRFLAEKTRTNYFMDPAIEGKITVIGPNEIPLGEAITFLEAALESRGFTVVDSGSYKQVIPRKTAAAADVPLFTRPFEPTGSKLAQERTVTEIMELAHAPVAEVKAAVEGLLSEGSQVIEHAPTNKLILTATVRNLDRLRRVVAELDVPVQGKTVNLIPVRHRKADDLAKQIAAVLEKEEREKRVVQTKEVVAQKPALLADPAQNLLVVVATRADFERIRRLVERVDVDPDAGPSIEFLRLKHAEPKDVVEKVTAALKSEGIPLPAYTLVPDSRTQSLMLRTTSENLRRQIRAAVTRLDEEGAGLDRARVQVYHLNFALASKVSEILSKIDFVAGAAAATTTGSAEPSPAGAKNPVGIVADENTNSLVITAPPRYFPGIEEVVAELDVSKPQVMVEVLIAEVDYDWAKGAGLDFNFLNGTSSSTNRPFGIGNTDQIEGAFAGGGLPNGLSIGMLHGRNFDLGAAAGGDLSELSKIAVLMRLFQNTTHANILSSPTLMTSDNETARIAVGEQIQVPASFATAANTGLNTVTSFNQEDLGVILEITPRITLDDHVLLKVDQSIRTRTGDLLGSLETPVLSNREVTTSINAFDGDTVVIGGLLSEEEQLSESRVPVLSKLPGIGALFRSRTRTTRKTNLMIFLTPHIVRSDAASRQVTARSREEIAGQIDESRARKDSTIRKVFAPGRGLGRYRTREEPAAPGPRTPVEPAAPAPAPLRAAPGDIGRRIDDLFERIRASSAAAATGRL